MASQQKNVGILAMEIYFPPTCVQQEALEAHDGVSKGKYTIGLGQDCLAFCTEVEDVISMSLTAVTSLLEKYGIDPKQIGRLEVGSETVIDKSKSIKTFLMQIFEETGNTDIEGVDSTNACYGGTAALLNCVNWVESSSWDGRYGLVVCTDSAVYAEGPARPTGGAAAIAMLIGPDAPIAFESKIRGSHMSHVYDFYKPNLASEYPVVDGKLSQTCYLMAVDSCYNRLCNKYEKFEGKQFSVDDADYFVFHSPYNKLVQKSFARLLFNDFLRNASSINEAAKEKLAPFSTLTGDESYQSRDLEKATQQVAKALYDAKVQPTTLVPKQVGNMYTASLYAAFASLIHKKHSSLVGQRIVMFSYGSGLTATMFSFRVRECQHPFSLSNIAAVMNVDKKLKSRHEAISRRSTLFEMIRDYEQATMDLQRLVSLLMKQVEDKANQSGASDRMSSVNELRQAEQRLSIMEEEARKEIHLNMYLILGVDPAVTASEIKKAYRKAALRHHPDKAGQCLTRGENGDDGL